MRDQAAFARCLGIDPLAMAAEMVQRDLRRTGQVEFFTPERDLPSSYQPINQLARELDAYRESYRRIWDVKETSAIQDLYFHGADVAIPGGETVYGHGDIDRFVIGYLASFPDAVFRVESSTSTAIPASRPARTALVAERHACRIRPLRRTD